MIKKGYLDRAISSVYQSDKNIIITSCKNSSTSLFYFLNKDFDISYYLKKIVDKPNQETINDVSAANSATVDYSGYADTNSVEVVDTVAYNGD